MAEGKKSVAASGGTGEGHPEASEVEEEKLTLEQRLGRLDEIVSALESGDVELDRGLELFEEGVRHIRKAERVLAKAELKVEELVGSENALRTRPMGETPSGSEGEAD